MKQITRIFRDASKVEELAVWIRRHFETDNFPLRMEITKFVPARSGNQNATIHMWFDQIAQNIGDTQESVKQAIKNKYLPMVPSKIAKDGETVMRRIGTRELNSKQMSWFMDRIKDEAAFTNTEITEPR